MGTALASAGEGRRQETSGDLHGLVRVEIDIYPAPGRLAAKQADVLAVRPVVRYLLLSDPQRFPAGTAGVLLAGRDRDYGHTTTNEGSGRTSALLRAHATPSSVVQSVRATSKAAAISASGTRPSQ